MKTALVGVKRVVDHSVKIRVKPDGTGVVRDAVKHSMNPFCEIALEQAVKLKEASHLKEVVLASIGGPKTVEVLRHGLALGADRAIHITCDDAVAESLDALTVSKALAAIVKKASAELVFLGKQSIDGDVGATPAMVAGLLGWAQATQVVSMEVRDGGKVLRITREIDAGTEVVDAPTPCVLSADLRLNTPRYAALQAIMKAKQKKVDAVPLADVLGGAPKPRVRVTKWAEPPSRAGGVKVATVEKLYEALHGKKLL